MRVGLVDIGSNTVVLVIYKVESLEEMPITIRHESNAVRLVNYIQDQHMDKEGIEKAAAVLAEYKKILEEADIKEYYAFITEPARNIDNYEEMHQRFLEEGFDVQALSGQEEAEFDFFGSQLSYHEISTGNAFDIGGGSTELITFKDHQIVEAVSIPYGCVRLSEMPLSKQLVDSILSNTFNQHPTLHSNHNSVLIGIGGTCRATYKMMDALHHTGTKFPVEYAKRLYDNLLHKNPSTLKVLQETLNENRQQVFLPGLNMLLAIAKVFDAKEIQFSQGCVREGFLYHKIKNSSK